MTTRVHLLELIELRAKQWQNNENMNAYYTQKLANLEDVSETLKINEFFILIVLFESQTMYYFQQEDIFSPETPSIVSNSSASPPLLGPSDVCKSSGKFTKPTRIPGKNYCKDEVVIRNSDSGKGENKFCGIYLTPSNVINLNK